MDNKAPEDKVATLVQSLFQSPGVPQFPYHNLEHTRTVVSHVTDLGIFYLLDHKVMIALKLAAWFHDIGHLDGSIELHEERSIRILEQQASSLQIQPETLEAAAGYIRVTKSGAYPLTLPEQIICDADTWHFGTNEFLKTDQLVRQEMELRTKEKILNWYHDSFELLTTHQFYTDYCQLLLTEGKHKNIEGLFAQIIKAEKHEPK